MNLLPIENRTPNSFSSDLFEYIPTPINRSQCRPLKKVMADFINSVIKFDRLADEVTSNKETSSDLRLSLHKHLNDQYKFFLESNKKKLNSVGLKADYKYYYTRNIKVTEVIEVIEVIEVDSPLV